MKYISLFPETRSAWCFEVLVVCGLFYIVFLYNHEIPPFEFQDVVFAMLFVWFGFSLSHSFHVWKRASQSLESDSGKQ